MLIQFTPGSRRTLAGTAFPDPERQRIGHAIGRFRASTATGKSRSCRRFGTARWARCRPACSLHPCCTRRRRRRSGRRRSLDTERTRASGTCTSDRCVRRYCTGSATCRTDTFPLRILGHSNRCKARRHCSSPDIRRCLACTPGPPGSPRLPCMSNTTPPCTFGRQCRWRKGRRYCRSRSSPFRAGNYRSRRSSHCRARRYSSVGTPKSRCCKPLPRGSPSPTHSSPRHFLQPRSWSSSLPARIRHRYSRLRSRLRCPPLRTSPSRCSSMKRRSRRERRPRGPDWTPRRKRRRLWRPAFQ